MLLIVCNDPEVPAGNFAQTLSDLKIPSRALHPYKEEAFPAIDDISAVIVLGGAMGVHDTERHPFLAAVRGFIHDCLGSGTPMLGICLGGQMMADLLGGKVTADSSCGEKGTLAVQLTAAGMKDPLFAGIPAEFTTFQWHNDSFELPPAAIHLASSAACPGQAFRFGKSAWGTQFHPEVDRSIVENWARCSDETSSCADRFVSEFIRYEHGYMETARRLLGNFLRAAGMLLRQPEAMETTHG